MSQWYLSKKGKAVGPLSEEKIIEFINKGELSHLDLVFETGGSQWLSLSQVDVFKGYLGQQEPQHEKGQGEPEWVLLKKIKKDEESKYEQLGPFAESEVLKWLDRGEIKFTDFAWKKGLESWVRISEVEAFAKPLPSSPEIDRNLYEPTQALETETLSEETQKESLSQFVQIERFDPEKTQVTRENSIPINNEDFVTESELTGASDDVNLWSLEPPGGKGAKSETTKDKESTRIQDLSPHGYGVKKASEHRKKSATTKKTNRSKSSRSSSKETIQLVGALCAFAMAFVFLYLSFTSDKEAISSSDELSAFLGSLSQIESPESSSKTPPLSSASDLQEKVRRFKEMAAKAEVERNQIKETQSKLSRAKKIKKELLSIPSKKMQPAVATTLKTKPSGTLTQKNNSLVSAQSSVKLKKMPIPGKKNLVSPKKTGATAGLQNVSKPSGSAKDQSFYKQRDRLALFYSSLKAETLAMEIQSQFKKLQKNKTAWTHYYGQWRKKVRSSLAQDIRTFPSRSKTYAYPQLMASFKRDYELFYKYGETFDLKVRGVRIPSDSPRDMKSVFTKYRRQALGLGH